MIVDLFFTITGYVFSFFLWVITPFVSFIADTSGVDISAGIGYVFGNIYLMDSFLPITELFILAYVALSFKTAILGYKVVLYLMSLFNFVRKTFTTIRI